MCLVMFYVSPPLAWFYVFSSILNGKAKWNEGCQAVQAIFTFILPLFLPRIENAPIFRISAHEGLDAFNGFFLDVGF